MRKFRKRFRNLPVDIRMPEELAFVPMDAILIEQVITNLLENAALHAKGAAMPEYITTEIGVGYRMIEMDTSC